jgi:hypothetical protein
MPTATKTLAKPATGSKTNTTSQSTQRARPLSAYIKGAQTKDKQGNRDKPQPIFHPPTPVVKPQPVPKSSQAVTHSSQQEPDFLEVMAISRQLETTYSEIGRLKDTKRLLINRLASITTGGVVAAETCGLCGFTHTGTDC